METNDIKVLVACEYSGIVRDAFLEEGFDAYSCDIRETESNPNRHFQEDVFKTIERKDWDLMVAHPPCTYLANSGSRWLYEKDERWQDMIDGAVFFRKLYNADIPHIAVENPIMNGWAKKVVGEGKPDQSFQPYHFGHLESKRICLWLNNLPKLSKTNDVEDEAKNQSDKELHKKHWMGSGSGKERSRFFEGVAEAMAKQWGSFIKREI